MKLLGFKTILHKKCMSGKNSEGPAGNSWVLDLQQNENKFQKVFSPIHNRLYPGDHDDHQNHSTTDSQYIIIIC